MFLRKEAFIEAAKGGATCARPQYPSSRPYPDFSAVVTQNPHVWHTSENFGDSSLGLVMSCDRKFSSIIEITCVAKTSARQLSIGGQW
jgi:hypothetical protein